MASEAVPSRNCPPGFETCGTSFAGNSLPGAAFDGVPVGALELVMAERIRAIEKFGHTPEADRGARVEVLPARMRNMCVRAYEDLTMHRPAFDPARLHRERQKKMRHAVKELVQACALGLAAIDRITYELEQEQTDET
jgi:hypothetical protein